MKVEYLKWDFHDPKAGKKLAKEELGEEKTSFGVERD